MATAPRDTTQEELIGIVDVYPTHRVVDDRYRPPLPPPDYDDPFNAKDETRSTGDWNPTGHSLEDTIKTLVHRIRDPIADNDAIFTAYQALPYPRISHLESGERRNLIHRLVVLPTHNETTLLRYLSVMDDFKAADLSPPRAAWNSAIHIAGRPFATVTDAEAESALYVWKDMEQRQGMPGDEVTFNILFNIATKAHKFALADMIVKELEQRGLEKTTSFRVSAIFRAGRQRDGDAVRKAYREFVKAGEIVTTTVLNCVITALHQAGESGGADAIFERMRTVYGVDKQRDNPPEDFLEWRAHIAAMQRDAIRLRNDPDTWQRIQNRAPLRPDRDTFRIMVKHACTERRGGGGDLDRVDELLALMRAADPPLPLSRPMFNDIFYAFARFGKRPHSTVWSRHRLELKWLNYLTELERDPVGFALTRKMALAILRAFLMCVGRKRMSQIWLEIRARWKTYNEHKGTGMGLDDLDTVKRWVRKYGNRRNE